MEYPDFEWLRPVALKAGEIMKSKFGSRDTSRKKDGTLVVNGLDRRINEVVIKWISAHFPNISIVGEEGSHVVDGSRFKVYCDPVDGTLPFYWGASISTFCISVTEGNVPLVGIIYDPFCNRLWSATRGKGSFLNGMRISVSGRKETEGSTICLPLWRDAPYNLDGIVERIMQAGCTWINPASVAFFGGLVASGIMDGTIFPGQCPWETSAMQVIVEEAGGRVSDLFGDPMSYKEDRIKGHVISNGFVHEELVRLAGACKTP